jgi:hypothetical protein
MSKVRNVRRRQARRAIQRIDQQAAKEGEYRFTFAPSMLARAWGMNTRTWKRETLAAHLIRKANRRGTANRSWVDQ